MKTKNITKLSSTGTEAELDRIMAETERLIGKLLDLTATYNTLRAQVMTPNTRAIVGKVANPLRRIK